MNFNQFAFLNVSRNKRAYLGYFLSNVLIIMVFFTFSNLSNHPFLLYAHPSAVVSMRVASIFILFFSFFYVAYSMSAFLQLRKKEFGILMVHGLSPKQLRKLIRRENFYIGIVATVVGIILGFILSFLIALFAKISLDITIDFYFPIYSLILTIILFTVLFFIISTYVFYKISKNDLVLFLKQDKARTAPKASLGLAILGVVFILLGYAISLFSPAGLILIILLPVATLVTIGTYFLVSQLLVFLAKNAKKNQKKFWSKTNMLLYSDLDYRLKDNARSFFFISIITTLVFCSLGTLFSLEELFQKAAAFPYDYSYTIMLDEKKLPDEWLEITDKLKQEDQSYQEKSIFSLTLPRNGQNFNVISESEYNRYVTNQDDKLSIPMQEAVWFRSTQLLEQNGFENLLPIYEPDELSQFDLTIDAVKQDTDFPSFFSSYLVVNDEVFKNIEDETQDIEDVYYTFSSVANTSLSSKEQIAFMKTFSENHDEMSIQGIFQNSAFTLSMINEFYAPVLFIGIFVGIVFFISAGSFLYFRLYGDLAEDTQKFKNIARIGLTKKEAKTVVTKQLILLFGIPMIIALFHGTIALNTMAGMFEQTIMSSAIIVMAIFAVIQFLYFLIARQIYLKKVLTFN